MGGILCMMLVFVVLIVVGYGFYFLWIGIFFVYMLKVVGSYGILMLIVLVIILIIKFVGEKYQLIVQLGVDWIECVEFDFLGFDFGLCL